ncbi:MAG: DEAD/DEAH box helicase family protein [Deltaproteobacteria bacterium]|nr:DEAD/DEAH box helicase family protein [Deltaproteobacteria bacterium]
MTTAYHAKYWAHQLTLARPHDGRNVDALARSLGNARVDLNPHQIDAALFALRSPFSKGALLADEVGLGKTIEAGLVLAQKWAERRRRILLVVPATLRKQWALELESKFFLPSVILEAKTANQLVKGGATNPFDTGDAAKVVIASYQFVYARRKWVSEVPWDLVVMDEAHRLRSVYKDTKTATGIRDALPSAKKLLLTATPLQNTLLELYGLVSLIEPDHFGSKEAFQELYMDASDADGTVDARNDALRERLKPICQRTLRRQVTDYIQFTRRMAHTADFVPSAAEVELYDLVSDYLARERLVALPNARRKLITLILRKLLASSTRAIGATLEKIAVRLRGDLPATAEEVEEVLSEDFETAEEVADEWEGDEADDAVGSEASSADRAALAAEVKELERFVALARAIPKDAKAQKLVESLPLVFTEAATKGAQKKAVIFTESVKTQNYLFELLEENGYSGEVVLLNGTNADATSRAIYNAWKAKNKSRWKDVSSGSRTADMKAAIVEEFRDRKTLLLATESAAEGINLQFCSVVINYDLPWNPQRVEQRIGRCHRYGQKCDVLVVNFLNRANAADQRVFELLDQKFRLFEGVFGASDEVLGVVEDGMDLEKTIADIYQRCRSKDDIQAAFDALQVRLDAKIQAGLQAARRSVLEHFDEEVHEKLRIHRDQAKSSLDRQQRLLLDLARWHFGPSGTFSTTEPSFSAELDGERVAFHMDWEEAERRGISWFREGNDLAEAIKARAEREPTPVRSVAFQWAAHAAPLEQYRGRSGWLALAKLEAESLERTESVMLVVACTEAGEALPADIAERFFGLDARVAGPDSTAPSAAPPVLDRLLTAAREAYLQIVEGRSQDFFQEESERIEQWSEDLKVGLERQVKRLEKEVDALRKQQRRVKSLQEKLDASRQLRDTAAERDRVKREWYAEQDRIRARQDQLIDKLEAQVAQRSDVLTPIYTIAWTLV